MGEEKKKSKDEIIADQKDIIARMDTSLADMKKLKDELEEKKNVVVAIRSTQALCLGIFTLGLAMATGDVSSAYHFPVSALSITTTLFGGMGTIICEIFARLAKKW